MSLDRALPPPSKSGTRRGGLPPTNVRRVVNRLRYLTKTGCQWRLLPKDFPPWPTVHHYYRTWRLDGTLQRIHIALRRKGRVKTGLKPTPSAGILDSQLVKTTGKGGIAATTRARRSRGANAI